ncbi:MAG TPA: hypothetical protein VIV63_10360 [Steroidobacteraceae bacterium]
MKSFVVALALAAFAATAVGAEETRSVALVRAMRSDEIAVATAKLAFLNGSMRERYGKTNNACVKRIAYTDFTAGWARVVESVLSPTEIETSLGFFQSDAGVKYVEGLLRRLRARQGEASVLPEIKGKEEITPPQLARISEFSSSDLGRKVMGKDLNLSPAAEAMGNQANEQIAAKCGGK